MREPSGSEAWGHFRWDSRSSGGHSARLGTILNKGLEGELFKVLEAGAFDLSKYEKMTSEQTVNDVKIGIFSGKIGALELRWHPCKRAQF